PPPSPLFPYTTLFRSPVLSLWARVRVSWPVAALEAPRRRRPAPAGAPLRAPLRARPVRARPGAPSERAKRTRGGVRAPRRGRSRSEEHTSELQSPDHL